MLEDVSYSCWEHRSHVPLSSVLLNMAGVGVKGKGGKHQGRGPLSSHRRLPQSHRCKLQFAGICRLLYERETGQGKFHSV